MKTRWFYAFILSNLLIAISISMVLVAIHAEQVIFDLLRETRAAQGSESTSRFEEYIRGRTILLEELAKRPSFANAVMGSSTGDDALDDYMQGYSLLGRYEPIFLVDIFGNTTRSFHFSGQPLPFSTSPWLTALIEGGQPAAVLLESFEGKSVFAIAVPIIYGQFSEGALVSIVTEPANSVLHIDSLSDGLAFKVSSPYFTFASQTESDDFELVSSITVPGSEVRLEYLASTSALSSQKNAFMLDIGIGIVLSLLAAFSLLAVVGRQYILNPYLRLERSQREISAAKTHNDLLVAAIDASPVGVSIADANAEDAPLTYVNSAFEVMTGYSADEVLGKNCRFLSGSNTDGNDTDQIREALKTGRRIKLEILNYRKNGEAFWNQLQISPVFGWNQQLIAFVGIQQDITQQIADQLDLTQAKNAAEAAAQTKSDFLANMSHEIRTPMNGVQGMLALVLKSDSVQGQMRQRLEIASGSANSLLVLIDDILDFSKIEAGKLDLEEREFNLVDLLSTVSQATAFHAQSKGLHLVLDTTQIQQQFVRGDENRIRQILLNLISNATKFTHQGEVIIRAKLEDLQGEDCRLTCVVQDTGIGIPNEKLEHIFDSFGQADTTTTRKYGGTGLGLSIVKQLCELMDGQVSAKSVVNQGSEFEVSVRLQKTRQAPLQLQHLSPSQQSVLVVDAHSASREVIARQLTKWHMQVVTVASYDEAKTLYEGGKNRLPDFALVEVLRGDDRSFEFCRWLRQASSSSRTKIIIMANLEVDIDPAAVKAHEIDAEIAKPVTPSDLFDALNLLPDEQNTKRASQPLSGSTRILLVEDNLINQEVALGILEELGLDATCADTGLAALDLLSDSEAGTYDLVLMDCQMPDMDGYDATRAIRKGQAGQDYLTVPIVAMTANAMSGDKEKCLAAGMNDYLTKPIDEYLLEEKLHLYLKQ